MSAVEEKTSPHPVVPANCYEDPAGFLLQRGWKPLGPVGDKFFYDKTRWLSPYQPHNVHGSYKKVPVFAPNADGEMAPVMVKGANGRMEQVHQVHYTPAAEPVGMWWAVEFELNRDAQAKYEAATSPAEVKEKAEQALAAAQEHAGRTGAEAERVKQLADELEAILKGQAAVAPLPPAVAEAERVAASIQARQDAEAEAKVKEAARLAGDPTNNPHEAARRRLDHPDGPDFLERQRYRDGGGKV